MAIRDIDNLIHKIGNPVSVTFEDGETVDGWVYGEVPQGYLISLDPDGEEIRLIPKTLQAVDRRTGPNATFSPPWVAKIKLRDADDFIRPKMEYALKGMNFTSLLGAVKRAGNLSREILRGGRRWKRRMENRDDPGVELAQYLGARTDQVVELHTEVYEELERVRLPAAVQEAAQLLHGIPGKYLLPAADARSRRDAEVALADLDRWQQTGWTARRHRRAIDDALRRREELFVAAMSKRTPLDHEDKKGDKKSAGDTMRYIGAGIRILGGTALAGANIGISLTAGLASTVLTVGATAVPTYVGAVASIGAGLFAAADGFEKIGGIQKDKASA